MARFDTNNDNMISEEELNRGRELLEINLREEKARAQKKMAWIALLSMLIYAILPILPFIPADRLSILASMSDMVFLSLASIPGFYFGATAYMSRNNGL